MLDVAFVSLPFVLVDILLVLLAVALGVGLMVSFGYPGADNFRSRCPACHAEALQCIDAGTTSHAYRLRVFRCDRCGAAYREELDGSLVATSPES